jgi:hypothetical protein
MPDNVFLKEDIRECGREPAFLGGFSDVFRAVTATGQTVALKRMRVVGVKQKDQLSRVSSCNDFDNELILTIDSGFATKP